ncbi:MAG: hypothetical protein ACOYK8_06015 [Alphaproteobacteria bacterium]
MRNVSFDELMEKILYAQELHSFLDAFVAEGVAGMPQNVEAVLEDIKEIWQEHGFLPIENLLPQMVEKYLGESDCPVELPGATIAGYLAQKLEEQFLPDPLMGCNQKRFAGIKTGLCCAYGNMGFNNASVAIVEKDFINMAGTNFFFRNLIAVAEGVEPHEVDFSRYFELTDRVVRIICEVAQEVITAEFEQLNEQITDKKQKIQEEELRAGGDEERMLAYNIDPSQMKELMDNKVLPAIEAVLEELNMLDHPHTKEEYVQENRCGIGVAHTVVDPLAEGFKPENWIELADKEIGVQKKIIGDYRTQTEPERAEQAVANNHLTRADIGKRVENFYLMPQKMMRVW